MNDKHEDKLMADAANLEKEIAPQRDLWPGIEAAIAQPAAARGGGMGWFAQAAAVVLLVAGSSTVTYLVTQEEPGATPSPMQGELRVSPVFGADYYLSQEFVDARDYLVADLDGELDRLSPEARKEVEDNLAVIRQAISDINAALSEEPGNPHLQDLLMKTYREELAVMRNVGGLTQSVMSRDDI